MKNTFIFPVLLFIHVLCTYPLNYFENFNRNSHFYSNQNISVDDSISVYPNILVLNEDETVLNLASTFKDSLQLLYVIPSSYCKPMIQREISYINQFAKKTGLDKVIVLTNFSSHRAYISFKRSKCQSLLCYNIKSDYKNNTAPMILVLNKDLVIKLFYFSKKHEPQKTIEHLQKISENYFNVKNIVIK